MFGIAAVILLFIAFVFWLASFGHGTFFTWEAFLLLGLTCLAAHLALPWGRRPNQPG